MASRLVQVCLGLTQKPHYIHDRLLRGHCLRHDCLKQRSVACIVWHIYVCTGVARNLHNPQGNILSCQVERGRRDAKNFYMKRLRMKIRLSFT